MSTLQQPVVGDTQSQGQVTCKNGVFVKIAGHVGPEAGNARDVKAMNSGRTSREKPGQISESIPLTMLIEIL